MHSHILDTHENKYTKYIYENAYFLKLPIRDLFLFVRLCFENNGLVPILKYQFFRCQIYLVKFRDR